jgi:hypothetical protein
LVEWRDKIRAISGSCDAVRVWIRR